MRLGRIIFVGLTGLFSTCSALASTLIETDDGESRTVLYVEGVKMRGEMPEAGTYGLWDLAEQKFLMVNTREKTALDMSSMIWQGQAAGQGTLPKIDAKMEKVGSGPEIAGYPTVYYRLLANGKPCQDLYLSRDAFEDSGFAKIWARHGKAWQEASVDASDPCDVAEAQALDYEEYGWPLKQVYTSTRHKGQYSEVVRIEKDAEPPGSFDVPAGYTIVPFQGMMGGLTGDGAGGGEWDSDDESWDDESYDEEEYADETYDEESDYEDAYDEEAGSEEDTDEDDIGSKLKGFMDSFKKDD